MKNKLTFFISLLLSLCMLLSACGNQENNNNTVTPEKDNKSKTLTMATLTETTTLTPLYMGICNYSMVSMLYETLFKYEDGKIVPNLAESYEFNDDGTVLTMQLKKGITFHDGESLNAEAVKANLEFMNSNPQYMACPGIVNIENVKVVGDYTIEITYPHPYYGIINDFCWPDVSCMVSPKQIVEGDFQTVNSYLGTGPYIYDEYVSGQYTRFVRNENYWGETPYYDEIIAKYIPDSTSRLQALKTGEIDLIYGNAMLSYQDYKQATGVEVIDGIIAKQDTRARDIVLNASKGHLTDLKVRKAVAYAIDKQAISNGLTCGHENVANMPYPVGSPYTDIELNSDFSYNPEKSNSLLDDAGFLMGDEGYRQKNGEILKLNYTLDTAQDSLGTSIATLLKSQLAKVGIDLEIHTLEKMEWYSGYLAGDFDITYWLGHYKFASPHCFFNPISSMTPQTFSINKLDDKQEFLDAIGKIMKNDNPKEIQDLYTYLINYDLDNVIDIPLTYYKDMIVYNNQEISGYDFSSVPSFFDVLSLKPVQ